MLSAGFADSPVLNHYANNDRLHSHLKHSSVLFTEVESVPAREKKNFPLYFPFHFFPYFLSFPLLSCSSPPLVFIELQEFVSR